MLFEEEVASRRQLMKVLTLTVVQFTLRLVRPTSSALRMTNLAGEMSVTGAGAAGPATGRRKLKPERNILCCYLRSAG